MDQLTDTLAAIDRLASDPKAKIFGLAEPLRGLGRVLRRHAEQNRALASAVLRLHFYPGQPLTAAEFDAAVAIAKGGIPHGPNCPCMACHIKRMEKI